MMNARTPPQCAITSTPMKDSTLADSIAFDTAPSQTTPQRHLGVAALLGLLSMSCVQFGAALSAPTMAAFGAFSTTWLRLAWAAAILALVVRPKLRSYSRAHWLAAGVLGVAMAGMTLCF